MSAKNGSIKLVAGNSNPVLAKAIASWLKLDLTKASVRRFADMEVFVEIQENVRGSDAFIIQSTSFPANDHLMELLIITDALRRASARRITAVIPYFGYARQDRKSGSRTPISAKLVANLITRAGVDRVMTLDLHAAQIQGFFDIPTDNLFASPVMVRDIKERFDLANVMVVSPDVGGVVRARGLAKRINTPLAIIDKRRERAGESEVMNVIGDVAGYTCILVDDIVDSGGTLVNAADALLANGAKDVYAYITHGVLSGGAAARIIGSRLKELVITDSIHAHRSGAKVAQHPRAADRTADRGSHRPHRFRRVGVESVRLSTNVRPSRHLRRDDALHDLHDPRRYLPPQPLQAEQRIGAGFRHLGALGSEMLAEEVEMRRGFVELLRRQHRREYRDLGAQLHIHQRLDHGIGDEFVAIDAAVDHEPGSDDGGIAPGLGQDLGMQRDFVRTRHFEQVDLRARNAPRLDFLEERDAAFLDHLAVPGRLHKGNALRLGEPPVFNDGATVLRRLDSS